MLAPVLRMNIPFASCSHHSESTSRMMWMFENMQQQRDLAAEEAPVEEALDQRRVTSAGWTFAMAGPAWSATTRRGFSWSS